MILKVDFRRGDRDDYAQTLSREQREQARACMAEQATELMKRSPRENLYWIENKTDLMELAHVAYMTEMVKDGQGRPYKFAAIAHRLCSVLHVPMPYNPYSVAYNARTRKGVRQQTFFDRYCWMMYFRKISNPLNGMIKRMG